MLSRTPWIFATLFLTTQVQADWWLEATDLSQKADLQLLSDYGLIRQPINTYPLFWAGIKQDLDALDPSTLSKDQWLAAQRLQQLWQQQQSPVQTQAQLHAATDQDSYKSFAEEFTDSAAARGSVSF